MGEIVTPNSREERALDLLVQASRADATLREAVAEVEKWVRRLQEDRASAWQSYEEADREAEWQMGAKLEAQQALWLIVKALDLNPGGLPAGWKAATPAILDRIGTIVDEAERLAVERDRLREAIAHVVNDSPGTPDSVKDYLAKAWAPRVVGFCGRDDLDPHRPHHWPRLTDGSYGDYDDPGRTMVWCPGA